jgi:hypothetical protein
MASVSELRSIVQAWGDAFSKRYGTSCEWVDLYAKNPAMEKYQQYKLIISNRQVSFLNNPPVAAPSITFTQTYINKTSADFTWILSFHRTTTSTFAWSLTEAIDVGYQFSIMAPLPAGIGVGVQVNTSLSFSSTQEKQEQDEVGWEIEQQLEVPPNTKFIGTLVITQQKYDLNFEVEIVVTGYVAIWNRDKIDVNNPGGSNKHWLWFIPITTVIQQHPVPGYKIQGSAVVFTVHGVFSGIEGVNSYLKVEEFPAGEEQAAVGQQPNPEATYIIPLVGPQPRSAQTPPLEAFALRFPKDGAPLKGDVGAALTPPSS